MRLVLRWVGDVSQRAGPIQSPGLGPGACGGVAALADGADESGAGTLDGLEGGEVGGCGDAVVEGEASRFRKRWALGSNLTCG